MKIELNEKFALNSDAYCVWITELVRKKNGGGIYERLYGGYHSNIRDCLLSFASHRLNASEAQTMAELAEDVKRVNDTIKEFCSSIDVDIRERKA